MTEGKKPLFTPEDRRFLFELALLGLTGGCRLEGFVFSFALDTIDRGEPYALIAKAIAMAQFDQFEDADAILASPTVANSDLADYALCLRGLIAKSRGESHRAAELGRLLEDEGGSPSCVAMARMLAQA